jgi:Calpain family cysteine protease
MPINSVDALKSRFATALEDGRITRSEADALIAHVKDGGGVTPEERQALQDLFGVHLDSFDRGARKRVEKFISKEMTGFLLDEQGRRDLPDPAVLKEHRNAEFRWVDGQLFVDGVRPDDVIQGQIGDCYLVAAFAAIAARDPEAIERAIRDNGNGTYTALFYESSWFGKQVKVEITVDGQLPMTSGPLYAKNADQTELWVGLLEKAYAQWKGGYGAIGNGGSPGAVMTAVLGRPESYTVVSRDSARDHVYNVLATAMNEGKCAAAGTHGESRSALYTGTGLYACHAYSVLSVGEENGGRYVELRNPWGACEPKGDGVDDGIFKLPLEKFVELYAGFWVT